MVVATKVWKPLLHIECSIKRSFHPPFFFFFFFSWKQQKLKSTYNRTHWCVRTWLKKRGSFNKKFILCRCFALGNAVYFPQQITSEIKEKPDNSEKGELFLQRAQTLLKLEKFKGNCLCQLQLHIINQICRDYINDSSQYSCVVYIHCLLWLIECTFGKMIMLCWMVQGVS